MVHYPVAEWRIGFHQSPPKAMFSIEFSDFAWMFSANLYSSPALLAGDAVASLSSESVGALKYMQLAQLRRDSPQAGTLNARSDLEACPK